MKTVGLALGGGGAKGLAHISILRVLDRMGVDVVAISGTSIGAIVGAHYAAGHSGDAISDAVGDLLETPNSLQEMVDAERPFGWLDLLRVDFGKGYLLNVDRLIEEMRDTLGVQEFGALKTPLKLVAADFWDREEVVFSEGDLLTAIAASFCLPGIFPPVVRDGRVLVDGGSVNPVPFDLIRDDCDILIAVDVLGKRTPSEDLIPGTTEALFNTLQIAEKTIANHKLMTHPPDIYLEPAISDVKVLEFHKSESIFEQAQPECERLERELTRLLQD